MGVPKGKKHQPKKKEEKGRPKVNDFEHTVSISIEVTNPCCEDFAAAFNNEAIFMESLEGKPRFAIGAGTEAFFIRGCPFCLRELKIM